MRKQSVRHSRWYLFFVLCFSLFMVGCNGNQDKNDPNQNQSQDVSSDGQEVTPSEEPENEDKNLKGLEEVEKQKNMTADEIDLSIVPEELRNSEYDLRKALYVTPLKDVYKDYFTIGFGINGSNLEYSSVNSPEMNAIAARHFNSTTYTNLMKPCYLLDQEGCKANLSYGYPEPALHFGNVAAGLKWCQDNGIKMRGHTLVWHTQVPDWFFREGYDDNGAYVDKATMLIRLESYIKQVLEFVQTNYPDVIYCWDVVNEAVESRYGYYDENSFFQVRTHWDVDGVKTENPWYKIIGEEYVEKTFEFARKYADPDVKLFYNDYNTFVTNKNIAIYNLAEYLQQKGLIDGIGMQSYYDLTNPKFITGKDCVYDAILRFAKLGLEIHLTELSLKCDTIDEANYEKQAERYKQLFTMLLSVDSDNGGPANITNVTFFGLMDQYMFYENNTESTRLFDGKLQPKPCYYSIVEAAEEYKSRN